MSYRSTGWPPVFVSVSTTSIGTPLNPESGAERCAVRNPGESAVTLLDQRGPVDRGTQVLASAPATVAVNHNSPGLVIVYDQVSRTALIPPGPRCVSGRGAAKSTAPPVPSRNNDVDGMIAVADAAPAFVSDSTR